MAKSSAAEVVGDTDTQDGLGIIIAETTPLIDPANGSVADASVAVMPVTLSH